MIYLKKHDVTDKLRIAILSGLLLVATGLLAMLPPRAAWAAPAAPSKAQAANERIADSILSGIGRGTWIAEGHNKHVIYIFFDPNCPYCHQLYEDLRPWVNHNEVQLRWLPVGVLMATSPGKAAAILEAKNRLAAFRRNEQGFSRASGFGQIPEEPLPNPATKKELLMNAELLSLAGQEAVPDMVFRLKGGTPIIIQGAPPRHILKQIIDQLQ